MTSVPEAPGAAAIILSQVTHDDDYERRSDYSVRIKVLASGGLEYANVTIPYDASDGFKVRGGGRSDDPSRWFGGPV